jgi:adenylate cyclase
MNPSNFFSELKRRNVYKVAVAYAVVGWLGIQVASIVLPTFHAPEWTLQTIIALAVIGFPIALVIAWAFELTPEGIKRTEDADVSSARAKRRHGWIYIAVVAAALSIGLFFLGRYTVRNNNNLYPSAPPEKSIAVLPFLNMSSDKEQDYFSDGLSEELLNQLAQIPQLRVIARTSSFSFKGKEVDVATIAKALNVANVLEGSVRKSANTLRITAQLVRASDSSHLWSQTYDRELADVFKVQDEIARDVVSALKVKLLPAQQLMTLQRTSNSEAYEQVLIGKEARKHGGAESFQRAKAAFQRALDLDPNYANAYAGLAQAQAFAADFSGTPAERAAELKKAFANADKAIALAPDLAAGYWVRGILRHRLSWDWKGAQADFKQAATLDPNDVETFNYSQALFFSGHQSEAFAMDRKATTLDPLSPEAWNILGWHHAFAGQYAEARTALQRALELSPDAQWSAFLLGYVELKEGKTNKAAEYFRRAPEAFTKTGLAMVEYTLGHERESQQLLAELKEKYAVGFAYQIAQACAWRGDKNGAFEWLEHAYDQHDAGMYRLRYDPLLASLHDDPRFAALLKKMGFSE